MRFHGSIFPDSLAGLGANCETEAEMRAGCKNQIVSTPAPAPVPSYPADVVNLVAQILPAQSWVSKGLTGGMNIATIRKSVLDATQMFPQLPLRDVAKFIAETTADYIKHGGKTNRAIVNLKLESDGAGGTIATPYPLTFNLGKKWKCAGSGQLMSDQMWNQIVQMYGEDGAKSRVDDAYCGPDKHRALKAFAIGAATLIIGGVASAYLAPATTASGSAAAGAAGATGGVGAAGAAGATTATTAGAASALTAAAVPAGIEGVTVLGTAGSSVAAAITAGAVVAGAAAPVIASPTINPNPAPPQPTNPPAPSTPTSEVIETVTSTASAPAPVAANVANAITAGAVVASAAPPALTADAPIETVTSTASAPAPVAANVANAITAGAVVTSAAPPALTADAPIETVTSEATRIEQMPVDQATTLATGLVSVGIQIPNIPDIPPPEPVEIESGASEPGSLLSDTVKQNIQDAIAQYGADWVKQHLVDILADSTGVYPSDPVYDDALDYIDAGAPMQAAIPWWIFAGLVGGFLLMAATQKKGKRRARVRRAKRK